MEVLVNIQMESGKGKNWIFVDIYGKERIVLGKAEIGYWLTYMQRTGLKRIVLGKVKIGCWFDISGEGRIEGSVLGEN